MTILADKQIAMLCELPRYVIVRTIMVNQDVEIDGVQSKQMLPVTTYENTRMNMAEINLLASTPQGSTIVDVRELTFDEKMNCKPMIYPFTDRQVKVNINEDGTEEKIISYGCSSYGYDITLAPEFKIFTNINNTVVDPKNFDPKSFVDVKGDMCVIPPNSFVLGRSNEYFNMPNVVTGVVLGKSTYARVGISCLATPLECGWAGNITLEFANTTPLPALLYANEGCAQVIFLRGDMAPNVTYADRGGKYQGQQGITLPTV